MTFLSKLLLSIFLLTPLQSEAGMWSIISGADTDECKYLFSGVIEKGDFTTFYAKNGLKYPDKICLNSPGGSLSEAFQIIKLMRENPGVSTRVKSGHVCNSACALIFMFGASWGVSSPYHLRELEPGASLGFHSPFPSGNGTEVVYRRADVLEVAISIMKILTISSYSASTYQGPPLPPEILFLILNTPNDQLYNVDTVGEIKILGIEMTEDPEDNIVIPIESNVVKFDRRIIDRICDSSYIATYRQYWAQDGYSYHDLMRKLEARRENAETKNGHLFYQKESILGESIVGVNLDGYRKPGYGSAGSSAQYCRVEIFVKPIENALTVRDYRVEFGPLLSKHDDKPPNFGEGSLAVSVGLVPMETKY